MHYRHATHPAPEKSRQLADQTMADHDVVPTLAADRDPRGLVRRDCWRLVA
jgi:hypothetical protein